MSNHTPDSFLPEKCRILSGSALKMIAMMTMLIDHTGMAILSQLPEGTDSAFFFSGKSRFPLPAFQRYWQSSLPYLLLFAGRRISAHKKSFPLWKKFTFVCDTF